MPNLVGRPMTDTFSSGSAPSPGAQPDQPANDVTSALAELERKLRELEQELTSIGRRRLRPEEAAAETSPAAAHTAGAPMGTAGRLIDEQAEPEPPVEHASVEWATPAERATPVEERAAPMEEFSPAPGSASPSDAQLASLAELRRFRDRIERFARELTDDYDALLGRVMAGLSGRGSSEPSPTPQPPAGPEEALFEGRMELGVGPFYDIASLSAFEQSLARMPGVNEVAVRRFEASHAVVDLRLAAPVALVSELRRALQTGFSVRQVAEGRLLLTFDDA
ncbi:MAG: hypothetical protein ACHQDY_06860 [Solirubrobacterales bacterium]